MTPESFSSMLDCQNEVSHFEIDHSASVLECKKKLTIIVTLYWLTGWRLAIFALLAHWEGIYCPSRFQWMETSWRPCDVTVTHIIQCYVHRLKPEISLISNSWHRKRFQPSMYQFFRNHRSWLFAIYPFSVGCYMEWVWMTIHVDN